MPGMGELLIILVIVMLIFGAGKLPAIGEALGRSIKNFKRGSNGDDEIEVKKRTELETKRVVELESGEEAEEAEIVQKRKAIKKEA
jgi:sec-independent protein translocase protein TatA